MRNFLTSAIASVALATLLVGSAAAADMDAANTLHGYNSAEQDQLERDTTQHHLRQGLGAGEIVGQGDRAVATSRSSAALEQSPNDQVTGHAYDQRASQDD